MEIKQYLNNNQIIYDKLLDFFIRVDNDFSPNLSSYGNLKDYLDRGILKGVIFYIEKDNKIIGVINLYNYLSLYDGACIRFFAIDKDFRGIGIGKKLFTNAFEYYKENNINKIFLSTSSKNEFAIKFYLKNGFNIVETKLNARGFGNHKIIMNKYMIQ